MNVSSSSQIEKTPHFTVHTHISFRLRSAFSSLKFEALLFSCISPGVTMKKVTSEAPKLVPDAVDLGGDGVDGVVNELAQLQNEVAEEPRLENFEEEGADEEEDEDYHEDEEEEEEEEERGPQAEDGVVSDEALYEVEAIRRKRIRKGQVQYYIKWKDWPETANTWEPLENLVDVRDVVAAFEESLKSGKHRKRKRKAAVHHALLTKRLERTTTSYSLRPTNKANNHTQPAPSNNDINIADVPGNNDVNVSEIPAFPQTVLFADEVENNGDAGSVGRSKLANDNRSANASEQITKRNEVKDYDPKLSELKATTSNGYDADKIQLQEVKLSLFNGCQVDGELKRVFMEPVLEPVQNVPCRGSKKRKSGCVKRFTMDSDAVQSDNTPRPFGATVVTGEPVLMGSADVAGSNGHMNTYHARPTNHIVEIIKPVGYSAGVSTGGQDALVTFMALRSDGAQVLVDNAYLKSTHPLLLINFYEKHIRYTPSEQNIERGSYV